MKPSHLIWGWIVVELITFAIFSQIFSIFFGIILVIGGSVYGGYLLRQSVAKYGLQLTANDKGYEMVGAFLLMLPGLFSSIIGLGLVVKRLREQFAHKIWAHLKPDAVYNQYKDIIIEAQRADGTKINAQFQSGKKDD